MSTPDEKGKTWPRGALTGDQCKAFDVSCLAPSLSSNFQFREGSHEDANACKKQRRSAKRDRGKPRLPLRYAHFP